MTTFIDGVLDFLDNLDTLKLIAYFWPFFLLDITRYLLLDLIIITLYIPKRIITYPLRMRARRQLFKEMPLVSVIVPGKNEGKHIPRLAQTLSKQTYPNLEIVIVDDGSDDDTAIICRRLEKNGVIDRFIRNEIRGGKASAANTALRYSHGKYIVHVDADSHMAENSIETILIPFYLDSRIGAVGGDVRVANTTSSLTSRLQAIEYMKSISTGRTVSAFLGILRIIAGAHGAFRRDILQQIYGWDIGPGLDGDITLKIRKLGYKVTHEPFAICYTNVPVRISKLAKQRYRWDRSMIRFRVRKHKDIFSPSNSFILSNFIASVENVFFNIVLNLKWWIYIFQILIFNADFIEYILFINYVLYLSSNILQYGIACTLYGHTLRWQELKLSLYLPLMPIYTGLFLRCIRTYAYIMELLHKTSYRDAWNPWKVSKVAEKENL